MPCWSIHRSPFATARTRDDLILDYHSRIAEAGLPLVLFYLYEAAGGISYRPELLVELLARSEVLGIKVATLDSVMTFQDIAAWLKSHAPEKLLITGEDRFLGYSLMCGAQAALIGMAAACTELQAELLQAFRQGERRAVPRPERRVDDLAQHTFLAPMEGYIQRMLWCLVHEGVIPAEAAHDPWGPKLDPAEFDRIGDCVARLRNRVGCLLLEPGKPPCQSTPSLAAGDTRRVRRDSQPRSARITIASRETGLPENLDRYLRQAYDLDMTASYAGITLRNPWGKASGQLSLNRVQIEEAAEAGLGLVVLKTVIAQDSSGRQSMSAWAIKESQMVVEPIQSEQTGATGWTVTWKGRGWWQPFTDYLHLIRAACSDRPKPRSSRRPVRESTTCPRPAKPSGEPTNMSRQLVRFSMLINHRLAMSPMPLEKDFSPTLAGSDRVSGQAMVLEWLQTRSRLDPIGRTRRRARSRSASSSSTVSTTIPSNWRCWPRSIAGSRPRISVIYANRLFDPNRVFEGKRGVAYGGPDLSDRNLRVLSALRSSQERGEIDGMPLEISGTGDISSGRIAVEYALARMHKLSDSHTLSASRGGIRDALGNESPESAAPALLRSSRWVHRVDASRREAVATRRQRRSRSISRPGAARSRFKPDPAGSRRRVVLDRRSRSVCRRIGSRSGRPFGLPRTFSSMSSTNTQEAAGTPAASTHAS